MNIINNQLAEQIEMCDYSLVNNTAENIPKMMNKCPTIDPSNSMEVSITRDENFYQKLIDNNNQFVNQQQQQLPMSMSIDLKALTQTAASPYSGIRNGLYSHNNVRFLTQDRFIHSGHKSPVIFNQHYDDTIIADRNINQNLLFNARSGT
ncbi:hypothetical protein BLA29_011781, partial [Euroglyphus maynei]